jgi:hypothetical protein
LARTSRPPPTPAKLPRACSTPYARNSVPPPFSGAR